MILKCYIELFIRIFTCNTALFVKKKKKTWAKMSLQGLFSKELLK